MQNSRRAINPSELKEHSPVLQSTKASRFWAKTLESMLALVSPSLKIVQPSGMVARAACRSSRVQLIRSPTTLVAPTTVWMEKVLKIW